MFQIQKLLTYICEIPYIRNSIYARFNISEISLYYKSQTNNYLLDKLNHISIESRKTKTVESGNIFSDESFLSFPIEQTANINN